MCYYRGWHDLRKEDLGVLWEHYVLNEMFAQMQSRKILYWRDKRGHEIDFILAKRQSEIIVIECKWSSSEFEPINIKAFRRQYSKGENFVVASDVKRPFSHSYDGIHVKFISLENLIHTLKSL